MLSTFRKEWHEFHSASPGRRFQIRYHQRRKSGVSTLGTYLILGMGALLFGAGLLFIVAPGPGVTMVLVGGALMAQVSLRVARAMDRGELRVRAALRPLGCFWVRASLAPKAAVIALAALLFIGMTAASYRLILAH
jgi:hypothetical protein